ncbi:MAG: hypothetical protein EOM90_10680 [Alphaproteobacteria bacterium]|nr:hypothetical protein [Alphaproteobacteria bacterium]
MKTNNVLMFVCRIFLFGLIIMSMTTCKKETENSTPEGEFIIASEAKFVVNNDFQSMLTNIDSSTYALTFKKEILNTYPIKQGDLIVSSVGNGLLRKIELITETGNEVTIQTSQATLVDLIQQGDIDYKGTLTTSQIKSIKYYYPGVYLDTANVKSTDGTLFNWNIDTEIYPQIRLQGNFQYTSDFIFQIQISILQGLKKVKFGFEGNEEFNLSLIAGKQFTLNKQITLATVYFTPLFIPLPVPPFTIVVAPVLDIKLGLDGYANANITTTLSQNFSIETGLQYLKDERWSSYMNYDKSFNFTPPQLNMNAGAEAYLKPELKMLIYNLVGPYVNGKGYGRIEADLTQTPWWKMYYGFKMSAGVKATILNVLLFDFSVDDLLTWEQQVGQSTGGTAPTVTTNSITNITNTTATGGGNVTSQGSSTVTARGVCWSTSSNPTTSDAHTSDGSGTGSFTSNITGLTANTPYYVRSYATNSAGTAYGNQVSFTTTGSGTAPTVTTNSITNITNTTATGGGNVTSQGSSTVTARGVCWSTSSNPTISDAHTTDGSGIGSFSSNITSLNVNTPYYVRAYATNTYGIAYGAEVIFTTASFFICGQQFTDIRNGKAYNTVQIGTQCWMKENMNYKTGNSWCYNNSANCETYGRLYNWQTALGVCPSGWHLPADDEWTILTTFLGGEDFAGGKMKETGFTHWESPNTGATNESGFTALPGGFRQSENYNFYSAGYIGYFWSSTESNTYPDRGWIRKLNNDESKVDRTSTNKGGGFSVRCIKE